MKTISSTESYLAKRIVPYVIGLLCFLFILFLTIDMMELPVPISAIVAILFGGLFFIYARFDKDEYVDEVIDDGDKLIIRNRGAEEVVRFEDISHVDYTIMKPAGVWLQLSKDSQFGRLIRFLPGGSILLYPRVAASIRERIDKKRPTSQWS